MRYTLRQLDKITEEFDDLGHREDLIFRFARRLKMHYTAKEDRKKNILMPFTPGEIAQLNERKINYHISIDQKHSKGYECEWRRTGTDDEIIFYFSTEEMHDAITNLLGMFTQEFIDKLLD